jgi:hypothetical protein
MKRASGWVVGLGLFAGGTVGLVGACDPPVPKAPTPPEVPGQPASTCGSCAEPRAGLAHNQMPHNQMPHNSLVQNALMANREALEFLSRHPLRDLASDPDMRVRLVEPEARMVMSYIASCALSGERRFELRDACEQPLELPGELGLCDARSPFGSWFDAPPSEQCLEAVSACLLARVNLLGRRVVLSIRGEPRELFPLQDRVPVETIYRGATSNPATEPELASLSACNARTSPDLGEKRDCGWTAHYVGRCRSEQQITLEGPKDSLLRVCKGLYACDEAATLAPGYAGLLARSRSSDVSFRCPSSRAKDENGEPVGYYSVMVAPRDPKEKLVAEDVVIRASSGEYPACEKQVFTFREGAFWGNLFDPWGFRPPAAIMEPPEHEVSLERGDGYCRVKSTPAWLGEFLNGAAGACFSDEWTPFKARLTDRLCAGVDIGQGLAPRVCVVPVLGQCFPNAFCALDDGPQCVGDRDYQGCIRKDPQKQAFPITVFLNDPCDLVDPSSPSALEGCAAVPDVPQRIPGN